MSDSELLGAFSAGDLKVRPALRQTELLRQTSFALTPNIRQKGRPDTDLGARRSRCRHWSTRWSHLPASPRPQTQVYKYSTGRKDRTKIQETMPVESTASHPHPLALLALLETDRQACKQTYTLPVLHKHLSLIHIWRCRRLLRCRSRWSPYH